MEVKDALDRLGDSNHKLKLIASVTQLIISNRRQIGIAGLFFLGSNDSSPGVNSTIVALRYFQS